MGKREVSAVIEVRVHEGPGPGKRPGSRSSSTSRPVAASGTPGLLRR